MREVCDQCRRVIPSWRKPVLYANRIFCDGICAEDHAIIHDQVYVAQSASRIEGFMLPAPDQRPCVVGDP